VERSGGGSAAARRLAPRSDAAQPKPLHAGAERFGRRGSAAQWIAAALVLTITPLVHASSGRVALVQPSVADATIDEALHRIQGELVAEGFEVVLVSSPPRLDRPAAGRHDSASPPEASSPAATAPPVAPSATVPPSVPLATASPSAAPAPAPAGVLAAIDLTVNEGAHVVELRVVDRATDKVVIRRVPVEPWTTSHTAEILAVRAVELLRASLLELLVAKRPTPAGAPPPSPPDLPDLSRAARWAAQTLAVEREPQWGLEAGAALLADFGGIPPSAVALLRVQRKLVGPLRLRATVAGLLETHPSVDSLAGTASVTQDLGLVEMVFDISTRAIVHPLVSVGAGVLYEKVDGSANTLYVSEVARQWAAAADAGVGADFRLGRHWHLSLEAHAFLAVPYPAVDFVGMEVAHAGAPSVLASLTVVGWM
jgi:hypothetical protein